MPSTDEKIVDAFEILNLGFFKYQKQEKPSSI
jgi:hypothetical protein